ncbi:MAG TPA: Flp family type IVb pilin [Edaphobacter sp.]|jgi:pilus assembly protein Flp/PilA|nr:Flp family type IVb pilin [Edaphobacter sp.]
MTLRNLLSSLHESESGQDLIEYALVCALIALGAIAGMANVADTINNAFSKIGNELSNATAANPGGSS